ncbi:hypothetical protein KI387_017174, partial [Taxus chinensis]
MGNEEEEEDVDNENQSPPMENTNGGNLGVDNSNVNIPNQSENKKAILVVELTNDIKRIIPPKLDGTTLGDEAKNWLSEMEKYFAIRYFLDETKAIYGAYQLSNKASSWWDNRK